MSKSEIISYFEHCVRNAELAEEYYGEPEHLQPDLLTDIRRVKGIYIAAIRWMESEQDNDKDDPE